MTKRKNIVAGNWKMNLDLQEGVQLISDIQDLLSQESLGDHQVVICPPHTHIATLAGKVRDDNNLTIGAQNCHEAASGAYTGEISAQMVKSAGASYVIIGHSERRQYFEETNAQLALKLDAVLGVGLKPIFCIGETLDQRNSNTFFEVVASQLLEAAFHLTADSFEQLVLAYEPVWAIGTGLTATPEQAQEIHAFIRSKISERYGEELAMNTTILYGGSCNPKNANDLFSQPDIDGGLIGGASLKARDFLDIVKHLKNDI